ncbi:MAG: phosphoenolpyruvate carboxylase, partial [Staphylothermus sp.]|nr:phosphoenolpyruvate carboxylase [Staphylothermus sp.]
MIPALMATQHPDSTRYVSVYDEVAEAIDAYRIYSCDEVMVDYEGKLTPYHQVEWIVEQAFEEGLPIGEEFILTPRVPNDDLEDISRHIMAITEAILANIKAQRLGLPQVVKYVIMPMTENVHDSIRMQRRLHKIERIMAEECGYNISHPLLVIPLIEIVDRQIHSDLIIEAFHRALLKEVSFFTNELRIFLGKSDSALLNGHVASSIALKIALSKLHRWGEERFINIKPILGMGKPPFRGNLAPHNIYQWIKNWIGYSTVTIQSAIRYNTDIEAYKETIKVLLKHRDKKAQVLGEEREAKLIKILPKLVYPYRKTVAETVEKIYQLFDYIPTTRERIQHTKYHRIINGTKIPRAIKFVAGYYAIGLPPTLLD